MPFDNDQFFCFRKSEDLMWHKEAYSGILVRFFFQFVKSTRRDPIFVAIRSSSTGVSGLPARRSFSRGRVATRNASTIGLRPRMPPKNPAVSVFAIVLPLSARHDGLVQLLRLLTYAHFLAGLSAYVLVNNREKGNAPLTVQQRVEMVRWYLVNRTPQGSIPRVTYRIAVETD